MLHETIDMLDVKPDGIYVDATLGGWGTQQSKLSEKGHLYAFDQDRMPLIMRKNVWLPISRDGHLHQG